MKRVAAVVTAGLLLGVSACGGGTKVATTTTVTTEPSTTTSSTASSTTAETTTTGVPKPTSVVIHPMYFNASTGKGGLAEFTMSLADSPDKSLRVEFSEDEVGGMGDQYRAAVWNAVTVATLLTGSSLSGEFHADVKGYIDGPSAGALTTVALLALLRGDSLDASVTMTGTINPDGTVGPVGGIPEKVLGLGEQGIKTVLIPVGQRNTESEADGSLVDVVDLGKRNGVDVREVSDVYEAYTILTGKTLPRLQGSTPRLDETTYQRLKAKADEALSQFNEAIGKMGSVDPAVTGQMSDLLQLAQDTADRARGLETQGLQAGAFAYAWEANAYAQASLALAENLQVLFTQGVDSYFNRVLASQAHSAETIALFDTLKTFTPATLTDASALMQTYGAALDAYTVAQFGIDQLNSLQNQYSNGDITLEELAGAVVYPTLYLELAAVQVNYAKAIFEVGRDLRGAPISSDVDLGSVADFFRKAADANFASFRTTVVKSYADQLGVSEDVMLGRFADFDLGIAMSLASRNTIDSLANYIGEGEANSKYARLGFAIANYAENANLVNKYYSNGRLNSDGQVIDVRSSAALTAGLDLGKSQLGAAIAQLVASGTNPALEVAGFESAAIKREGSTDDKFTALTTYWQQFVASRVLAYIGGFPTQGLS